MKRREIESSDLNTLARQLTRVADAMEDQVRVWRAVKDMVQVMLEELQAREAYGNEASNPPNPDG